MEDREIRFEIVERIGVLGDGGKGWTLELNLVSWNGRPPKYDVRAWDPAHERMGKGVCLGEAEARALRDLLGARLGARSGA